MDSFKKLSILPLELNIFATPPPRSMLKGCLNIGQRSKNFIVDRDVKKKSFYASIDICDAFNFHRLSNIERGEGLRKCCVFPQGNEEILIFSCIMYHMFKLCKEFTTHPRDI